MSHDSHFPISAGVEQVARFAELNEIVTQFARTSVQVMDALCEIREQRLYLGAFDSWEAYCDSIHQISRQYGNRLATAGAIRRELTPIVSTLNLPLPENEAQLRELARLKDPQVRAEVYQRAAQESVKAPGAGKVPKITAKMIRQVARKQGADGGGGEKRRTPSQRLKEAHQTVVELEAAGMPAGEGEWRAVLERLRRVLGE